MKDIPIFLLLFVGSCLGGGTQCSIEVLSRTTVSEVTVINPLRVKNSLSSHLKLKRCKILFQNQKNISQTPGNL